MSAELYKSLREHIESKPDSLAFARLSEILYESGNQDAAFTLLEKGLEQNPSYLTGYLVLGRLHLSTGDLEKALSIYRKALEFDPYDLAALNALVIIELKKGNFAAVAAHLLQILSIDPTNNTAYDILLSNWGKIDEALPELTMILEEELPSIEVENIGGGEFSLIGTEPNFEIKSLPLIIRTVPEELGALDQLSMSSAAIEPVQLSEIEEDFGDLVEIDEIFKAFEAPVEKQPSVTEELEPIEEIQAPQVEELESVQLEQPEIDFDLREESFKTSPSPQVETKDEEVPIPSVKPESITEELMDLDWGFDETSIDKPEEPQVVESSSVETTAEPEIEVAEPKVSIEEPEIVEPLEKPDEIEIPTIAEELEAIIAEPQLDKVETATGITEVEEKIPGAETAAVAEPQVDIEQRDFDAEAAKLGIPENVFGLPELDEAPQAETPVEPAVETTAEPEIEVAEPKVSIEEPEIVEPLEKPDEIEIPTIAEEEEKSAESIESKGVKKTSDDMLMDGRIFDVSTDNLDEQVPSIEEILKQTQTSDIQPDNINTDELEISDDIFGLKDIDDVQIEEKAPNKPEQETEISTILEPSIEVPDKQGEKEKEQKPSVEEKLKPEQPVDFEIQMEPPPELAMEQERETLASQPEEISDMLVDLVIDGEESSIKQALKEIASLTEAKSSNKPEQSPVSSKEKEQVTEPAAGQLESTLLPDLQTNQTFEPPEADIESLRKELGIDSDTIDIEQIEGLQVRSDDGFMPPEVVEKLSGIETGNKFVPPDEIAAIDGIQTVPDDVFAEIPEGVLEGLLTNTEPSESETPESQTNGSQPSPSSRESFPQKEIVTATTAEIYAAQGMTKKAIEIYEQILAHTELSEKDKQNFTTRLNMLKKRLENT